MFVRLDPATGVPLYLQIADTFRDSILSGRLPSNHKLPTVRDLAARLRVNPATVSAAYDHLAQERLILSRVGSGTFVAANEFQARAFRQRARDRIEKMMGAAADAGLRSGLSSEEMLTMMKRVLKKSVPGESEVLA